MENKKILTALAVLVFLNPMTQATEKSFVDEMDLLNQERQLLQARQQISATRNAMAISNAQMKKTLRQINGQGDGSVTDGPFIVEVVLCKNTLCASFGTPSGGQYTNLIKGEKILSYKIASISPSKVIVINEDDLKVALPWKGDDESNIEMLSGDTLTTGSGQ